MHIKQPKHATVYFYIRRHYKVELVSMNSLGPVFILFLAGCWTLALVQVTWIPTPVLSTVFCLLHAKHPVFSLNAPDHKPEITSKPFAGTKE